MQFKKITIITGEYGSGKTNLAVNLAYAMKDHGTTAIVDIDTVNPYFRTADFRDELTENGIDVITPDFANSNLDLPVLNFDIERIIRTHDHTVIDVGGSDAGAFALGRYQHVIEKYAGDYDLLYVYNMYRTTEVSAEETVTLLREIEMACRMKVTGLVSNPNLGAETTAGIIEKATGFSDDIAKLTGLPVAFRCITEGIEPSDGDFTVKRKVKLIWE